MIKPLASPPKRVRTVAEVRAMTQEWLDGHLELFPNFSGAFLFGSIIHHPDEIPFPSYRDVDLVIVQASGSPASETNLEVLYKGLMIEVGFERMEALSSPAVILANPGLATNFSATRILADPFDILVPLQNEVRQFFAERQWVRARCEAEMKRVQSAIEGMVRAENLFEKSLGVWDACSGLTGMLALACLRPPTHRRSLVLCHEILMEQHRLDLHEQILRLWGSDELDLAEVQALLKASIEVFDMAVAIHKTPVPFGFKLHAHLRPYFLKGSQEMIDEGYHREATFWIALPISVGFLAANADGSEPDRSMAGERYQKFMTAHRMDTPEKINGRAELARQVSEQVRLLSIEMTRRYGI